MCSMLLARLSCAVGLVLLLATANASPLAADDIVAVYDAFWAGLPAGRIRLKLHDAGPTYHNEIEIESQGLPHLFTRFRAKALAEGRLAADRPAEPSHYRALYDLRKRRDSRVSMQFVNRTGATIAERGPDDTSRKPPLAEMFRKNTVDPLSALERIRAALRPPTRTRTFTIPVYDGARRFDIVGHILPKKDPSENILWVELTLRPIAGFKGETSEDGDPDSAPRKVKLTVTDDARLVPLSIEVPVFFMPLVIQVQRICPAQDACSE
jgi:Protein of unknown function (DUF3108)